MEKKTLGVISLGCDKNRVDSEKLLASVFEDYTVTSDISQAQIILINSCAFLESARKEAIDVAIDCAKYRTDGKLEKLIMSGCLPQKFIGELFDGLTEVDGFLGTLDYDLFNATVAECYNGKRVNNVGKGKGFDEKSRTVTTPEHYAYLKIADGCDNHCTYCLIPYIRGKYKSEKMSDLIEEASRLGEVSELILVAQDITRYGTDIYGTPKLVELLRALSSLDGINSIRLLYCYPDMLTDELIDEIANNDKIIKYIDIPLQHASDGVLKHMNRRGTTESYLTLVKKLKEKVPGIAIRSTFIAGFPGESEADVDALINFLQKAELFNAGFFAYSREEGTPAYRLDGQLPAKVKRERVKKLYGVQKEISKNNLAKFKGKVINVVCDGIDYDGQRFFGRAYFQAPDIDGKVFFKSDETVAQGQTYRVKITRTGAYDLFGRTV